MSQEALQQEAELEQYIDMKVEGQLLISRVFPTEHRPSIPHDLELRHHFNPLYNSHFTEIIQAMRSRDEDPDLLYVIKFLAAEEIPGLPPGGGITSK